MSTPAIFVVAFIVAALLDLVIPHPAGVLRAEFGTGLAGTLVGIGAGLIGLFGGKIDKNVKTALDGMRLSLRLALEALADFGGEVGGEQAKSTGIIARILGVVLLGLIHGVDNGITGLHNWLKNTLGPVLRALQKFRKLFLAFYDKWFKPIFDTIDVIRHVLQVLSFLHLDFARNLDQKLSDLEARLRKIILFPLVELNKVINQVNLVIDEFGFYQRYTLVRSMVLYEKDYWNTLWLSAHKREQEKPPSTSQPPPERTIAAVRSDMVAYVADDGGPDKERIDEHVADLQLRLARAST